LLLKTVADTCINRDILSLCGEVQTPALQNLAGLFAAGSALFAGTAFKSENILYITIKRGSIAYLFQLPFSLFVFIKVKVIIWQIIEIRTCARCAS
jgi:hypothetical protein